MTAQESTTPTIVTPIDTTPKPPDWLDDDQEPASFETTGRAKKPRTSPQKPKLADPQAERYVLGCMMIEAGLTAEIAKLLDPPDFYIERNRWIFEAILTVDEPDPFLVCRALEDAGRKVDPSDVTKLYDFPTSLHWKAYAERVRGFSQERAIMKLAADLAKGTDNQGGEMADRLASAQDALRGMAEKLTDSASGSLALRSKMRQADELLATNPPEIDWVIEDVLEIGGLAVPYGDSGIGKTWWTMHLAHCVASGRPWFGRACKRRVVVYLDAECGEGLIHRRVHMVCQPDNDLIFVSFPGFVLNAEGLALIEWLIEYTGAGLLVLDPLMNFLEGDENSVEEMKPQITQLHEIGEQLGCAIVSPHHENRAGGYRGSSSIKDICTLMLHLDEDDVGGDGAASFEHILRVKVKKQRVATMRDFSLMWFVEDGKFNIGELAQMRKSPTAQMVSACSELMTQDMRWPGKDQLIKAKELHGLTQSKAAQALQEAVKDNTLEYSIGRHNRTEIKVVGAQETAESSS